MKEKQVIIFCIAAESFAAKPLRTLSEQNKFYPIDMIFSANDLFRMQIELQIIAINNRENKCCKREKNYQPPPVEKQLPIFSVNDVKENSNKRSKHCNMALGRKTKSKPQSETQSIQKIFLVNKRSALPGCKRNASGED